MAANGRRRAEPRGNGGEIVVRPHTGFGVSASFDPANGRLQAGVAEAREIGGVYGELGEIPAVFYRFDGRLWLRVGEHVMDLDDSAVRAQWQQPEKRTARFTVTAGDRVLVDIGYRSIGGDLDIGLFIRDTLADPDRRSRIFTG